MKKIFVLSIISVFLITSCKKDNDDKNEDKSTDNIEVYDINENIGIDESLTVTQTCPDMVFSIEGSLKQVLHCEMSGDPFGCDGGGLRVIVDENGDVKKMNEGDIISSSASYESVDKYSNLSLENFSGQGEKYIGFASSQITSEGVTNSYGWLKIELNGLASNLKIHAMAVNHVVGNPIKAGQSE